MGGGAAGGTDYLCYKSRIAAELHATFFDVGAGDVEFVGGDAFGVFEALDYLDVVIEAVAEDVDDEMGVVFSQQWKLGFEERLDADVLQADGVEHAGGSFAETGSGGAFDGFEGEALGDEAAEAVEVDEMSEFEAVAEGAATGEDRISEAQGANLDGEVNTVGGSHCGIGG